MRKLSLFFISLLYVSAMVSCRKDHSNNDVIAVGTLKFEAQRNAANLTTDVNCTIANDTIAGLCPTATLPTSLIASFSFGAGKTVTINGVTQISGVTQNNFNNPVTYTVTDDSSGVKTLYVVELAKFTGLPIIRITTDNNDSIESKDVYVTGHVSIDSNSSVYQSYDGDMSIRLHGNTTIFNPKKPYKIKLNTKAALLGMPADKEWVLLANYDDKTLIRNYVAFQISNMFGAAYTPRSQFAEVYVNGTFEGNYQLTEEIKIATNRVNITEMDATDIGTKSITGGYLIEIDHTGTGTDTFRTNLNLPFTIHDPNGVTAQDSYIANYVQQTENAIYSENYTDANLGYANYINTNSFIDWFWVNEIFKNNDALFWNSCWMFKDKSNTLNLGPVWDFDIGAGNVNYNGNDIPTGWWVKQAPWMSRLFEDTAFTQKAIAKYASVRSQLSNLSTIIDNEAAYLNNSQIQNFKTWNILGIYVFPNSEVAGSYAGEITFLKQWLAQRIAWIDANLQTLQN